MEITAIKSNKNQDVLTHCGFLYRKAGDLKNGTESWRCLKKSCRGRINVGNEIRVVTEHCHEPQPEKIEEKLFRNELKNRAAISEEKPKSLILAAQRLVAVESAPSLPSCPSNQRLINRVRQVSQPHVNDTTLKFTLPDELKVTHSGDSFLFFDSGEDDPERILIFATSDNLDTFYNADSWYCDGTFSVSPKNFYQLYTIQTLVEGSMIPLAFALLPNKKEDTYIKMLNTFKYLPQQVSLDFELAASNAFKKVKKGIVINYCLFHLGQSIYRQVQQLGLTQEYCSSVQFKQRVKMLTCLAFLPVEDVVLGFESLQVLYEDNVIIQPLIDYFEDNYIGREKRAKRAVPRFPINTWNCHERTIKGKPRTNNFLEGWHFGFSQFVNGRHPGLAKLILKFKDEQKNSEMKFERILAGEHKVLIRPKFLKMNENLIEAVKNYDRKDIILFLKKCAYNFGISDH